MSTIHKDTSTKQAGERTQKTMERYEKEERTHNATNGSHHTPGPWNNRGGSGLSIQDARGQELAEVKNVGIDGKPNPSHANARLIAAAPELLAALKAVVHDLTWGTTRRFRGEGSDFIRAAIAKAEGSAQ